MEEQYSQAKQALLAHIREVFSEREEDLVRSHEEKFALLEDSLENASDVDELRVAFEQWHMEHSDDLQFEYEVEEMWDHAMNTMDFEDDGGEQEEL